MKFSLIGAILLAPFLACASPAYQVIHSFDGGKDGAGASVLLPGPGGSLIGTTYQSGQACAPGPRDCGIAFQLQPPAGGATKWTLDRFYRFTGGQDSMDGGHPLIRDTSGNLYGTIGYGGPKRGSGYVFRLVAPAEGQTDWHREVLFTFNGTNGFIPKGIVLGAGGVIFGTTAFGGGYGCAQYPSCGTVFMLTPPAQGHSKWAEQTLYAFTGHGDGGVPSAPIIDAAGNIYGTTITGGNIYCVGSNLNGCGVVFRVSPPAPGQTQWSETTLYQFGGEKDGAYPANGVAMDEAGNLFGTTSSAGALGYGTVFKLAPPAHENHAWTRSVIHTFEGGSDGDGFYDPLVVDAAGDVYGATQDGGPAGLGTVFELTPKAHAGAPWTETTLHRFKGGHDGSDGAALSFDGQGNLYGASANTIFRITP